MNYNLGKHSMSKRSTLDNSLDKKNSKNIII